MPTYTALQIAAEYTAAATKATAAATKATAAAAALNDEAAVLRQKIDEMRNVSSKEALYMPNLMYTARKADADAWTSLSSYLTEEATLYTMLASYVVTTP